MKKRFIILLFLSIVIVGAAAAWWKQALKPLNPTLTTLQTIAIKSGEDSRTISDRLFKANLIRSPVAFYLLARYGGYAKEFQAGEFRLSPSMSMREIADALTHGTTDIRVTIPEGWRSEEIALLLASQMKIPEKEFLKYATDGYMFPDTYQFPKDASAAAIAQMMREEFNRKVTDEIREQGKQKGLTLEQLITTASLVEREGKTAADRPIIASIILNRLKLDMKLDIDATIQYALGYQSGQKSWWKKGLTSEDLEITSAYNTYTNPGLPPGPIANPGIQSILAVVNAPNTEYLFYISDPSGKLHPAKTAEEHHNNVEKYLR